MEERRKLIRRSTDRDRLLEVERLQERLSGQSDKESRRRRRRAIRHNCSVKLTLKLAYAAKDVDVWNVDEFPIGGRMLDLSALGCSVFTKDPLDMGQEVGLVILLKNRQQIQAAGLIRWNKAIKDKNGFASGVEFKQIESKSQKLIDAFLHELDGTVGL